MILFFPLSLSFFFFFWGGRIGMCTFFIFQTTEPLPVPPSPPPSHPTTPSHGKWSVKCRAVISTFTCRNGRLTGTHRSVNTSVPIPGMSHGFRNGCVKSVAQIKQKPIIKISRFTACWLMQSSNGFEVNCRVLSSSGKDVKSVQLVFETRLEAVCLHSARAG